MWVGSNGGSGTISRIDIAHGGVTTFNHAGTANWGAVDPAGNLWTTDQAAGVIRRVNASDGSISTFRPGFPNPSAIAVDAAGDVYVAQGGGHHGVFKLRGSDGTSMWGKLKVTAVMGAGSLAVDASGGVWVPDYGAGTKLKKLDGASGRLLGAYDAGDWQTGIAVDGSGDIWVTNQISGSVTKLKGSDGSRIGTYKVAPNAAGIAIDGSGNAWVTNGARVTKLGPGGNVIGTYDAGSNPSGGIAVDASGAVWVVNAGAASVTKLGPDGKIIGTYRGVTTGGNLGDFTGFALQRFVMRKPVRPRVAAAPPARGPWTRLPDVPLKTTQYAALDEGGGV
ncbi:MAG: hypothetical protein PHU21_01735, partial [Elusimicrobia bacterium]|nr:hypothetical protein [Elusimicrobiota bacterium]